MSDTMINLKVTFEDRPAQDRGKPTSPMLPPARFHIWDGERLLAVSNGHQKPDELRRLGHAMAAGPALLVACVEAAEWMEAALGDLNEDNIDSAAEVLATVAKQLRKAAAKADGR